MRLSYNNKNLDTKLSTARGTNLQHLAFKSLPLLLHKPFKSIAVYFTSQSLSSDGFNEFFPSCLVSINDFFCLLSFECAVCLSRYCGDLKCGMIFHQLSIHRTTSYTSCLKLRYFGASWTSLSIHTYNHIESEKIDLQLVRRSDVVKLSKLA